MESENFLHSSLKYLPYKYPKTFQYSYDLAAGNTGGGTSTAYATAGWETRPLNTTLLEDHTEITRTGNQLNCHYTGCYNVSVIAQVGDVSGVQLRIQRTSPTEETLETSVSQSVGGKGEIHFQATKVCLNDGDVVEIQQASQAGATNTGFGVPAAINGGGTFPDLGDRYIIVIVQLMREM